MKKIMITAVMAAMGILAAPIAQAQPAQGNRPPRPERPERPERPQRPDAGPLDPEQRKQALLNRYDANNNGQLDNAEYIALGKDVESGRFAPRGMAGRPALGGPGPRGPRGPGAGGPQGPRRQQLLAQYDANENGMLDQEEREAIRRDVDAGTLDAPRRGPGRRGPGAPPRGADRPRNLSADD